MLDRYKAIISAHWQRGLTYRATVLAYRAGEIIEVLVLLLMWMAIFKNQPIVQGFTVNEMVTYILIGNIFRVMTRNFIPTFMAAEIKEGKLSMYLTRPMTYFSYTMAREIGRLGLALFLSLTSQIVIVGLFHNWIIVNADIRYLGIIAIMIVLGFLNELLLLYLVGCIAFWTDEVDGIYESIFKLQRFFAGVYFPLSFLPTILAQISFALPFAYTFFIPAQLYLKKIDLAVGIRGVIVQLVWLGILYMMVQCVWKRGLKRYEGTGA